jgi:hypothetical protein
VRRGLKKTFVGIFWIVIACGNASRFIPGHFLFGSVNFGELLLYAVVIVALPFYLGRLLMSPLYIVAVSITLLSLLIGLIKWGADFTAILYPIRLILQLSAAAITGTMIFELLGHDVFRFALLTSRVYFYVSGRIDSHPRGHPGFDDALGPFWERRDWSFKATPTRVAWFPLTSIPISLAPLLRCP